MHLQILNSTQNSRSGDPVWWCLLAEYPISEFLSDHDRSDKRTAGCLFQTVQELGISPECLEKIEMMLNEFANEALTQFKQGRGELPEQIRVFCQNKLVSDENSVENSILSHAESGMERAPMIPYSRTIMNVAWGYFLIERRGNLSASSAASSGNSIDLYLYQEGKL
jgi:hypothetical protein